MMHGYIGASGAGKTYTMQRHASAAVLAGWRVVVIDLMGEWPAREAWQARPRYATVATSAAARRSLAERPLTVIRPRLGEDYGAMADDVAAAAIASPGGVILALPEANQACPEGRPLPPSVADIARRYRHLGARIWWDSQQLADVSKGLWAQTERIHLFGGAHRRDGGRCRRIGGEPLLRAIDKAGELAVAGHPGWHVALRPLEPRRTEYRLVRA